MRVALRAVAFVLLSFASSARAQKPELVVETGHDQPVSAVAISPDGRWLASAATDRKIRLWEVATGRELRTSLRILTGHTRSITTVVFSPDSQWLASASDDLTMKIWEVATGKELRTIIGHSDSVTALAVSPDGRLLASGGYDKTIKLWDVARGLELRTLVGHTSFVRSVAFSPDGRWLASGSEDTTVRLWDLVTGRSLSPLSGDKKGIRAVVFSHDGRSVISAGGDTVKMWDVATRQEIRTLASHTNALLSVALSPDGQTVASGSGDKTIRLWDVVSARELISLRGHTAFVTTVAYSSNGNWLTSASLDGSIRFWNARRGRELARLIALDEKDWVVLDPEGRFDASPGGMQFMHWIVGHESIALDQLKERYYDPGLLAKVLGYNKEPLRNVAAFTEIKLFPEVSFEPSAVGSAKLELKLKNHGGGIGRVQVFVNDKELIADARGPTLDPTASEATLAVDLAGAPVKRGEKNEIRVVTWNAEGYLSSPLPAGTIRGFTTSWEPPGAPDLSPPNYYAIVVGVSSYSSPDLNLRFAAKDAVNMATALRLGAERLFGSEHVHITLLTSPVMRGTILATKANLERAFESVRSSRPGDVLTVYLAGHGVAIQDTYAYPTEDARTLNLTDPAVRKETSVTSEELAEWMKSVPALHQVMVLDTCNAGAAAEKLVEKREVPGDQVRAIERLKDRTGLYVLMGAAADRPSYEASQFGQGLLTYALLKGMKGAALRDGEYVDVAKLFQETTDDVPELAKNIGGIQQPRIASPGGASFDIGKLLAEDRREIPLATVKPLLLRPLFLNTHLHRDTLGLSAALRKRLQEESFASTERGVREPKAVFIDEDDFPSAISPSGDYTINGKQVEVTVVLSKDGKDISQFTVEGSTDDLPALYNKLADAVVEALSK